MTVQTLKYKVITSEKQYDDYCHALETLLFSKAKTTLAKEEISLLTLLIEKWDADHNVFSDLDPVEILKSLMKDHRLKSIDLAKRIDVSPGLISDIINYKKGFSKNVIRSLSEMFKLSQETFNRPYKLKSPLNAQLKNATVMNTRKNITAHSKSVIDIK